VLVGASLGYRRTGSIDPLAALLVLVAALLMQVATNLQNDVGYTVRAADRDGTRSGFPRATATGVLSVFDLRAAIVVVATVALGVGLALAARRGWAVLAVGAASLTAALAYMGGPRPIAYTPFGEVTVFVFFGVVAVTGTDWAVTGSADFGTVLASMAIGALASAALAVNNHRDAAHDRLVGRRTFAVTFGGLASGRLFTLLLLGAFAMLPWIALQTRAPATLLPFVLMPVARKLQRALASASAPQALTGVLLRTFRLELEFAVLLSVGALIG
jgi:1,4-dihydroxy-2-naphthoate octaprenyltransferase